jgi:peptide methionine sulfoxide reductase MsrA
MPQAPYSGAHHALHLPQDPDDRRCPGAAGPRHPYGDITTEIVDAGPFYYAEDYHQQYLAKNPNGYCGLGGTGVSCPVGLGVQPS